MAESANDKRAIILVGHGAVPKDCPRDLVTRLKALEGQRRVSGRPPTAEELELEARLRHWPRSAQNDPYRAGLETLAERVRPLLNGARFTVAYNEFCAPTVAEAVQEAITEGIREILVVPSMLTPGGVHSELEIPESLARLRERHPGTEIRYAWPFDLELIARLLAEHLQRFC